MKLIKCSDHVCDMESSLESIIKYARFLHKPLELGMFIPTDKEGNVLTHPIITNNHKDECQCKYCIEEYSQYIIDDEQFQEAKQRVLFEGFELGYVSKYNGVVWAENDVLKEGCYLKFNKDGKVEKGAKTIKTIEDLTDLGLTLTKEAIKQIK